MELGADGDGRSIANRAALLLSEIGDPDADTDKPHVVMVSDPVINPGFREFYGPYSDAAEASVAVGDIRRGFERMEWTYTVHPLRPTPKAGE